MVNGTVVIDWSESKIRRKLNSAWRPAQMNKWPERLAAPIRAADNTAMAFWQSRHNLRQAPQLTDLRALARAIRGVK